MVASDVDSQWFYQRCCVHCDSAVQEFDTSPFFSFHHLNAYEHGNYITVDTVAWDELSFTGFNVDSLSAAYYECVALHCLE